GLWKSRTVTSVVMVLFAAHLRLNTNAIEAPSGEGNPKKALFSHCGPLQPLIQSAPGKIKPAPRRISARAQRPFRNETNRGLAFTPSLQVTLEASRRRRAQRLLGACQLLNGVMKIEDICQPDDVFTNTPLHLTGTVEGFSPGPPCVNSSGVTNTATLGATLAIRTSLNCGSS